MHTVRVQSTKNVRFNDHHIDILEVQPYSESLPVHPHLVVATSAGWKRIPSRSDPFTGKSSAVMTARRQELALKFRSRLAIGRRRRLLRTLKRPKPMDVDRPEIPRPSKMDLDIPKDRDETFELPIPVPSPLRPSHSPENDPMEVDSSHSQIFAARTKPVKPNKFQKRVGAKTAKKLELAENAAFELEPADATTYRALAARCNYLSQDRPDIAFSSKELCREFSVPNRMSFQKLKRLARYLNGLPRLVYRYPWQAFPDVIDVFVDTDFAGCQSTRRSTSGGVALLGSCLIKHWSKTQTTISLSSGEAELHGIAYGAAQALGLQSLLRDLGWQVRIRIHSDATAAIGICRRKGIGKIRHLATTDLWIQDKVRSKVIELCKVLGTDNPADVLTKYVSRQVMEPALERIGLVVMSGRPVSAPKAMGA